MVRNCSSIFVLLFLLLSCDTEEFISVVNFNTKGITDYCNNVKKIDVNTECGLVEGIYLRLDLKTIRKIDVFLNCYSYKGQFNHNKNKSYNGNADVIVITNIDSVYFNSKLISLDSLKNTNSKELYIIRNDWESIKELKYIYDNILIKENVKFIFQYNNRIYQDNLKKIKVSPLALVCN